MQLDRESKSLLFKQTNSNIFKIILNWHFRSKSMKLNLVIILPIKVHIGCFWNWHYCQLWFWLFVVEIVSIFIWVGQVGWKLLTLLRSGGCSVPGLQCPHILTHHTERGQVAQLFISYCKLSKIPKIIFPGCLEEHETVRLKLHHTFFFFTSYFIFLDINSWLFYAKNILLSV